MGKKSLLPRTNNKYFTLDVTNTSYSILWHQASEFAHAFKNSFGNGAFKNKIKELGLPFYIAGMSVSLTLLHLTIEVYLKSIIVKQNKALECGPLPNEWCIHDLPKLFKKANEGGILQNLYNDREAQDIINFLSNNDNHLNVRYGTTLQFNIQYKDEFLSLVDRTFDHFEKALSQQ